MDAAAAARALRFLAGVFLGSSGSAASSGRSSGSLGHFDEVCYRSGSLWVEAKAIQNRSEVDVRNALRIHIDPLSSSLACLGGSYPRFASDAWYAAQRRLFRKF